jgi:hypothetical protein
VQCEADAAAELAHFQNSYPSDPRSFFPRQAQVSLFHALLNTFSAVCVLATRSCLCPCIHLESRAQTLLATEVLRRFKEEYPSPDLFRPITKAHPRVPYHLTCASSSSPSLCHPGLRPRQPEPSSPFHLRRVRTSVVLPHRVRPGLSQALSRRLSRRLRVWTVTRTVFSSNIVPIRPAHARRPAARPGTGLCLKLPSTCLL